MFKFFISLFILLCIFSLSFGDETEGKISFGLKGGGATYFGDIKNNQIQMTSGIYGNYWIASFFAFVYPFPISHSAAAMKSSKQFCFMSFMPASCHSLPYSPPPRMLARAYTPPISIQISRLSKGHILYLLGVICGQTDKHKYADIADNIVHGAASDKDVNDGGNDDADEAHH